MLPDILILVGLTVGMRIIVRLFYPDIIPGSDTYAHLWNARYFHQHKKPHPKTFEGMKGTGYYPFLYHMMLGLGGYRYQRIFEVISSPMWDAIAVVSVYLFSKSAVSFSAGGEYSNFPFWLAILYGTSPSMFQGESGPRSFEGTPRSLAETLFLLMALSGLSYVVFGVPLWFSLGMAALLGGLMLLTSKFSLQALLFLCIPAAFLSKRIDFLLFPVLVMLVATVISYGSYPKILKRQIAHLVTYAGSIQKNAFYLINRNNPKRIANEISRIWQNKQTSTSIKFLKFMEVLTRDITPTALIYRCPQFVFALLIMFNLLGERAIPSGLDHPVFRVWFWAALFPVIFTSFYPFLFLGEAERYQNYSLFPQYIFITAYVWVYNARFMLLAVQLGLYLFYAAFYILRLSKIAHRGRQLRELMEFINNSHPQAAIMVILTLAPHELEYHLRNNSVFPSIINKADFGVYYKYPYIHPGKLPRLIAEQNAGLIVVERLAQKKMAEEFNKPYDLSFCPKEVFSNDLFYVLKTDRLENHNP